MFSEDADDNFVAAGQSALPLGFGVETREDGNVARGRDRSRTFTSCRIWDESVITPRGQVFENEPWKVQAFGFAELANNLGTEIG